MKFNKFSHYILTGLLALLPWCGMAAAADQQAMTADSPLVMSQVIRAHKLPIAMSNPLDEGTLLFSDSPEYPVDNGVLYGDKVSGDTRVYFYHVNQNNYNRKIVVVAYNPNPTPVDVTLKGYQYAKPSKSYYDVGKELSVLYYEGYATVNKVRVEPHGYALIGERLNDIKVMPDQLFSGIVDFDTPDPLYISSVIMPKWEDWKKFMYKQLYLPSDDVKLRGTFHGKDRYLHSLTSFDTADGTGYIILADGIADRFLQGVDVMDNNRPSEDTGNYGVDYKIRIRTKGTGNIHVYFNPMGGEYAGVAEVIYPDGKDGGDRKIVELPRKGLSMGLNDPYAMEYIDSFPAGKDIVLHFMPPGAANLPVRFLFVPDAQLQQAAQKAIEQQRLIEAAEARHKAEEEARRKAAEEARKSKVTKDQQDATKVDGNDKKSKKDKKAKKPKKTRAEVLREQERDRELYGGGN